MENHLSDVERRGTRGVASDRLLIPTTCIHLSPLRDRRDILPLSEAFLTEVGRGLGRPPAGISRDARKVLMEHRWPGNVRELRNILERAAILSRESSPGGSRPPAD